MTLACGPRFYQVKLEGTPNGGWSQHSALQAGEALGDEIFYTDKRGGRDHECLSLGCDKEAVLDGRTPLQTYADFIEQFAASCMEEDLWGEPSMAT